MYWKNNVEAFRYYLALKSRQFQRYKDNRQERSRQCCIPILLDSLYIVWRGLLFITYT